MIPMKPLRYRPWKGKHFNGGYGRTKKRLLLCGLSHYDDAESPNTTVRTIEAILRRDSDERMNPFFPKVEHVVMGKVAGSLEERQAFWNAVAFANLVQHPVSGHRDPSSAAHLREIRATFPALLKAVEPDVVFVFTKTGWSYLPDSDEIAGCRSLKIHNPLDDQDSACVYPIGKRQIVAGLFNHPSRPVLKLEIWHRWAQTLLSRQRFA